MRELEQLDTDVLVIGLGAAGLFAAASLARENKNVIVVGSGTTATSLSTGCISFIRDDIIQTERGGIDLESLVQSVHPFNDIIDRGSRTLESLMPEMSSFFVRSLSDQGLEMTDDVFHFFDLLTNAGTSYTCSIAPFFTVAGRLDSMVGSRLALLGILGHGDLDPDLVAAMFKAGRRKLKVRPYWTRLKASAGRQDLNPCEAAWLFRSGGSMDEIVQVIKELDEENVAIPPLFKLAEYQKGMSKIRNASGRNVFEMVTPLSLPGLRLQEALEKSAVAQGCRLLRNRKVTCLEFKGKRAISALLQTRTRAQKVNFNSMILATGDLVGGGLAVEEQEVKDPLQAFKVGKFDSKYAFQQSGYEAAMRDIMETGFLVTNDMRLLSKDGKTVENAFGAGAALAGFSFPTGVGLGGSLLTAWVAALHAREVS